LKKLRLTFFLSLILLLSGVISNAQTFVPGIHGGLITSQMAGDGMSGFNKLGVTFGGFVTYKLNNPNWAAQFEIQFVQKGSRNDFSISENDPTQTSEFILMRFNYVEIPLLFSYSHRKFKYEIGAYYGRLIGFYYEVRSDLYGSPPIIEDIDAFNNYYGFTNPVSDNDFGVLVGLQYEIQENLFGSLRFSNSVIPIKRFESGAIDPYPTSVRIGWLHTVVAGTIRYSFGSTEQ
jgi:hypothetical protein